MHLYESGGIPPLPQHMISRQQKCECGNVYVGLPGRLCNACAIKEFSEAVTEIRATLNGTLENKE